MNYYCILPPAYGEKRTEKPASGLIADKNVFGVSLKGSIRILTFLTIAIFANDTMSYEAPKGNPSFCAVNFFPFLPKSHTVLKLGETGATSHHGQRELLNSGL